MIEASGGGPVYASRYDEYRGASYPIGPLTTSPGAILSSHAERSWGFRATVLVGLHETKVSLLRGGRGGPLLPLDVSEVSNCALNEVDRERTEMKVYTASKFSEYERVRRFNDDLRAAGHIVTHDWTRTEEFGPDGHPLDGDGSQLALSEQAKHAQADLDAAAEADVVVLLPVPDMGGAYVEVGYALAHGKRVIVAGEGRFLIFWGLSAVTLLPDEAAARELFGMRSLVIQT